MKRVNINTRLKNLIFVGNGFLLVPDFFCIKRVGYLEDILGNELYQEKPILRRL